uniref:Pre-B-cell leukemia homeobox interacting protein 1b n=1 Tax=Poecilia latipinna TaxID=48699 RepID=A0A3B3U0U1_9TELE
ERRRKSLLEQIGRKEEEEEEVEEEFQVPQRENDGVFSLNKCILAALILLGLGTVFFSGEHHLFFTFTFFFFPSNQAQKEELKVAKEQAAEGEEQRLLWEEVEKENSRLKTEIASLPVLQKENDRMKKELESVPALQKELETLRSTVTNLKLSPGTRDSVGPPGKQPWKTWGDQKQKKEPNKVKYEINDKKQQKEKDKSVRKEGDGKELKKGDKMEWKKGKHEHGKLEKDKDKPGKQKRQSDEASPWKQKELKKGKGGRGDDGRPMEDKEGRKKLKEDGDRKKGNFEKVHERKEKGEWRGGKHRDEKLKGEMEWKKGKHGGKEKQERKDWKEKGDKKDPEWKDKIGKEGKGKGERKQWDNSKSQGKERTATDERKQWKEYERKSKSGKEEKKFKRKDKTSEQFKIEEMKLKEKKHNPHHTHPKPSIGQPEYWLQQRQRLQHDPKPPQHCDTLETCAQAEGLLPVPSSEFESVLQTYLTKIEESGVDGSKTSELRKIALEFFKDGVFVHNQRSFQDFVDDLADILEDMVEDGDAEDSDLEDEMEGFEKEVLKMFSLPGGREKEKRIKDFQSSKKKKKKP